MLKYKINLATLITGGTIPINIGEHFTPILDQDLLIKNNLTEDVIDTYIDYEKIKITPTYYVNNEPKTVKSITFTPNFFINNSWTTGGTSLSDIGYDKYDVSNNRMCLSKTFIRLSFYDTDNLKTQNLLYFSNIFIDSGKLFGDYISNKIFEDLSLKFTVENPNLQFNKSSEGFNIYLFKDDLKKNEIKTIYLKVEYNNALNGVVSLFLKNHPTTPNGYTILNIKENMFIKINIKYEQSINEYVYFFDDEYSNDNINLNLYQAKVS